MDSPSLGDHPWDLLSCHPVLLFFRSLFFDGREEEKSLDHRSKDRAAAILQCKNPQSLAKEKSKPFISSLPKSFYFLRNCFHHFKEKKVSSEMNRRKPRENAKMSRVFLPLCLSSSICQEEGEMRERETLKLSAFTFRAKETRD